MSEPRKIVKIDFFADLVCPWCYVGWAALKRAAEARPEIGASVSWRNFLLNPEAPAEGYDRRTYLEAKFGAESAQLKSASEALQRAAEAAGAPLNLDAASRLPNTIDGHRLIHWAAADGLAELAIDALFDAYFVEGRDIGAARELLAIAEALGLDPQETAQRLKHTDDRAEILMMGAEALRAGVTGVPVAIFNRKKVVMGAESPDAYGRALDEA